MSSLATNAITDASGGNTTTINGYTPTVSNMAGRNRIINGDMRVNQRVFSSSSGISNGTYTVDRWQYRGTSSMVILSTNTDAPSGFTSSINMVPFESGTPGSTEYYSLVQRIEGHNIADMALGTASATPITVSFWVKSNLTGTFGGSLEFDMGSYVFSYTINTANTWEQKVVTFTGLSSSLCVPSSTTTGTGLVINLTAGAGASRVGAAGLSGSYYYSVAGATNFLASTSNFIRFAGVQLEAGSVATPFEHRQYGQELALCQRYFQLLQHSYGTSLGTNAIARCTWPLRVTMRAAMTLNVVGSPNWFSGTGTPSFSSLSANYSIPEMAQADVNITGGPSTSGTMMSSSSGGTGYFTALAEL
jgi:hypothetical protein